MSGLREQKRAFVREALRTAALELFAEQGFAETTVAQIAARVGVSERTFFRYFKAKEDVLLGPLSHLLPRLEELLRAQPDDLPPLAAVAGAMVELADDIAGARPVDPSLVPGDIDQAQMFSRAVHLMQEWQDAIRDEVARRTHLGPDEAYPQLVASVALGVVRGTILNGSTLRAEWRRSFDLVAAGLPAPKARKSRRAG